MITFFSKHPGTAPAFVFLLLALFAFGHFLFSGNGFAFFVMTAPWGAFIPDSITTAQSWSIWVYPASWVMIALNAALIWRIRAWWVNRRPTDPDEGAPQIT